MVWDEIMVSICIKMVKCLHKANHLKVSNLMVMLQNKHLMVIHKLNKIYKTINIDWAVYFKILIDIELDLSENIVVLIVFEY